MSTEQKIEQLFDSLRKVLFYVGHGKYNDYMSLEEVEVLKCKMETILNIEKEYESSKTQEEKEAIYQRIEVFETYSVKDFIDYKIVNI